MSEPLADSNSDRSAPPLVAMRVCRVDGWAVSVCLLTLLMCLPFLRAVYSMGDEGVLLNGAARMLHGERLYTDFFEFLPPGGFVLTEWWFAIIGVSFLSARLLGILVIVGVACFTYLASLRTTSNASLSMALTIGWVAASQGYVMTQLSHHWFTTLFSMVAFWAALGDLQQPSRGPRASMIAGTMTGAAMMITPTCGALVWIAAATSFLPKRLTRFLTYSAASVVVPAFLFVYLLAHNDLMDAYAECIQFTAAHYASIQGAPFGFAMIKLQHYPLVSLFPLTGMMTIIVYSLDGRRVLANRPLHLCVAFALAGFVGCFPRPDIEHIAYATPLTLPLFAYCIANLARHCRAIHVALPGALLFLLWVPSALMFWFISRAALHAERMSTPSGDIAVIGQPGVSDMIVQIATTSSGEGYFFYPYMPLMSFLTKREQISRYDLFTPGYTLPSQYQEACASVMQHANWVVLDRRWTPTYWKMSFPAMLNSNPPEMQGFERALDQGFDLSARFGKLELRHRRPNASAALCIGIVD